jgi:hypothetical protein
MPDNRNQTLQSLPVANYSPAIARAVEWLGDRYLRRSPSRRHPVTNRRRARACRAREVPEFRCYERF